MDNPRTEEQKNESYELYSDALVEFEKKIGGPVEKIEDIDNFYYFLMERWAAKHKNDPTPEEKPEILLARLEKLQLLLKSGQI